MLRTAFADEVGTVLSAPGAPHVFVERFAHGGMTSGHVALDWWRSKGLPLLLRRAALSGTAFAVRSTTEDDWAAVRALRIQNAAENPVSYGASLATTRGMSEGDWRLRARRGTGADTMSVVAERQDGGWLGMMSAQEHDVDGSGALLTGVYVVPEARGRRNGVSEVLLAEVVAWAALRTSVLRLWVDVGPAGAPARRFYERAGFRPTGRQRPAMGFPDETILEMVRIAGT